jgi:N utilization substance protein B
MGARRIGRERALQALYQMEMSALRPEDALDTAWNAEPEGQPDPEAQRFALELVRGVVEHRDEIDGLIEQHSHNWRLDRMARVDRNVLRLAVFELKWRPDIPKKVTLNEAVELGKAFGTEASSAFVNGLLDRIALDVEQGR